MKLTRVLVNGFLFLLVSHCVCLAQGDSVRPDQAIPAHPRILMFKSDEAAIKKTIANDPTWTKLQQAIVAESDRLSTVPPIERIQIGRRLLDKSREALRRLFFLAYTYRMTGQQKYVDRAEKEMLAIAAFSDWNPSHFLDVAEMTMGMALGYDWLYDQLPASSRATIREAILKKGLEPSFETRYNNNWLRAEHNWNQVCNAGMTYGAMALYEDHPEMARQIINRALRSIVLPMKDYGPDGAYPEGYGYWGYGTSFNVMFISAVEKLFGHDFGLSQLPGFLKTPRYLENMTGAFGKPFNYSDAGSNGGLHPSMFWFATKLKDPTLLWVEKGYLTERAPESHIPNRLLPAIMLWSGGISINTISPPKSTTWVGHGKVPVALMRTNWTDTNAIYVGMKGGSASVNHAHMDIGSFVMDANGERWAMDFGMQEYESLESKGIRLFGRTQDAQRWTVFRLTNLVHNTLTFNNQHQRVEGVAGITSSSENPSFMHAVTDLTEVYKGSVSKVSRGIAIVDKSYVVVRDEVETGGNETTIRWTMLTPSEVKLTGNNQAELTQDGKKLFLRVQSPIKVSMKTWSTDPPNSYDAPNPGTALVGFEMTVPPNTKTAFNVELIPENAIKKATKKIQSLDTWKK